MRNYNSGVTALKKGHAHIERQRKRTISICVGRHSNGGFHDIQSTLRDMHRKLNN